MKLELLFWAETPDDARGQGESWADAEPLPALRGFPDERETARNTMQWRAAV